MHTSIILSLIRKEEILEKDIFYWIDNDTDIELLIEELIQTNQYNFIPPAFKLLCYYNEQKAYDILNKYSFILDKLDVTSRGIIGEKYDSVVNNFITNVFEPEVKKFIEKKNAVIHIEKEQSYLDKVLLRNLPNIINVVYIDTKEKLEKALKKVTSLDYIFGNTVFGIRIRFPSFFDDIKYKYTELQINFGEHYYTLTLYGAGTKKARRVSNLFYDKEDIKNLLGIKEVKIPKMERLNIINIIRGGVE